MANRTFVETQLTLVKRQVTLFGAFSVGAAGAVTLQRWIYPTLGGGTNARTYQTAATAPVSTGFPNQTNAGAEGIRSVTRISAGRWNIQLQDNYQRCLGVDFTVSSATGITRLVPGIVSGSTVMSQAGGSLITLQWAQDGVATDPANGDTMLLAFNLSDATEP